MACALTKLVPRIAAKTAWTTIDVRDGEKGPLVVEAAKVRVRAKTAPGEGYDETLVVIRERQTDGSLKHDYYLSNAPPETPLGRVRPREPRPRIASRNASSAPRAKAAWRITKCARGVAGIIIKRFRCWRPGSSRRKPGRGKKSTPAITVPQVRAMLASSLHRKLNCDHPEIHLPPNHPPTPTQRNRQILPLEKT